MKLVLRVGGHLLFQNNLSINSSLIGEYARLVKKLRRKGVTLHLVIGGGMPARMYISALSSLGASKALEDYVGSLVTKANAYLFITALGEEAYPIVPENYHELLRALGSKRVVVCGGLQPGQSTVAVAALIAETIGANMLINATNVNGIYTTDPRRDPHAKLLREITINRLLKVLRSGRAPGTYQMFDEVSLCIMLRSKITSWVINGNKPENVLKIIRGEHVGTKIIPQ